MPRAVVLMESTEQPILSRISASQTCSNLAKNVPSQSASQLLVASLDLTTVLATQEVSLSSSEPMRETGIW